MAFQRDVSNQELESFRQLDTCMVANAIETFNGRSFH